MAIITISRELAALGDEIASELAKHLNYRFIGKKMVEDRIKSYGIDREKLQKYDERKPSFFASLSGDRDDYLHYLKSAVLSEAEGGDCIFIGRGACAIFNEVPGVIQIYLISSMETRIARVKSYFHCDEKQAMQVISQSDQNRIGFHKYFFDMDWKDPGNYQITLNTSHITPHTCAKIIEEIINNTIKPETNDLLKQRLKDMAAAQSIVHHVLYEKNIAINFLEVSVSGAKVILFGVAASPPIAEAAVSAAKEMPLINEVSSEIQIVHEYSVLM
ncbi:MAG: cytidylate kinase family protein [Termitinemataceae bacterium]|nr:MAG: cytidylate kinase family protein [Termitinemataceae bacterium]